VFSPLELMWALIGLVLTIGATWLEAFVTNVPWQWSTEGVQPYSLQVSFQVGAVLLTGCLGGKNAAALSQIGYLALGLLLFQFFGLPLFTQGGGSGLCARAQLWLSAGLYSRRVGVWLPGVSLSP
jgi:biotin transport system substrate-specific component